MLQQVLTVKNNQTVFVNKTDHIRTYITPPLCHYEFVELPSVDIHRSMVIWDIVSHMGSSSPLGIILVTVKTGNKGN